MGHVDLAKKLGEEARKTGCGEAEIRWDQRESLILGLGLSQVWEEDRVQKPSRNVASVSGHWSGLGSGNRAGGKS